VQRPVETVKYCALGGGAGGFEHTRQPVETTVVSESHLIDLLPNVKLAGPKSNPTPLKDTSVPAVLGKLSLSLVACVEKAVAAMLLPMASEVGVMEHVWLLA
jgi:hypothetical protein